MVLVVVPHSPESVWSGLLVSQPLEDHHSRTSAGHGSSNPYRGRNSHDSLESQNQHVHTPSPQDANNSHRQCNLSS